jgi:hypothetical protein
MWLASCLSVVFCIPAINVYNVCRIRFCNTDLCIRKDQQYALICTTPLLYILVPTCFGSILPSSGSFLDPPELLEIQIKWVVYHIMCGYGTCVPDCRGGSKKLPDYRLLPKHVGANT